MRLGLADGVINEVDRTGFASPLAVAGRNDLLANCFHLQCFFGGEIRTLAFPSFQLCGRVLMRRREVSKALHANATPAPVSKRDTKALRELSLITTTQRGI